MVLIGVTGGIATGKSTATKMFGWPSISADQIYHQLLESDADLQTSLYETFGTFDREELATFVFKDAKRRELLNTITHPFIIRSIFIELERHAQNGEQAVVLDAPLLIQTGLHTKCNKIIAVVSSKHHRISRLISRDGMSQKQAESRIRSQPKDDFYISEADLVIRNNGDLADLQEKCERLLQYLP
jgi:dephospho-CoA kinase